MQSTARPFRLLLTALLGCLALCASACTQGVGDINRTQPDLIRKSDFDGKWFIRQSVIDVPPTSVASFEGETGGMEMLTWDIQQDYLVGYRAYELVPGSDQQADSANATVGNQPVAGDQGTGRDPTVFKGNPLYAYKIVDHVDVKRSYNSQTGEQTNVIEENTSDRPWYQRDWMRIDWSSNDVDSFLNPSVGPMDPFMLGDPIQAAGWVPENEGGPDAFRTEKNEQGEMTYLDFTSRLFVRPSPQACGAYLWDNQVGDCTDDEVRVRTSMLKVDPAREQDYIPQVYDDQRLGEFGYFRTERPTYNRQRGNTFTGLILLADRHDIWKGSVDASGNTVPEASRDLRPITYTLSPNFPEDMIDVAKEVADDWDAALKRTAATVRDETVPQLEADLKAQHDDPCLFCLDTNEDGHARNGDLRYNFLYWVQNPQRLGPLGYGPSSAHPETGRMVAAEAYVYGAGIDSQAAIAKDIVDLLNGDLTDDSIRGGDYVRQAVASSLKAIDPRAAEYLTKIPLDQLETKLLGAKTVERLTQLRASGLPAARPGFAQAQLKRIQGDPIESMLLPPEVSETFDPNSSIPGPDGKPSSADDPTHLSIANWGTPDAIAAMDQVEKTLTSGPNCLWLQNFNDPAVVGLARDAKDSGLTGDELNQYLRKQIFKSVMLHEVGHTLGLRHNFAGSADSLNYGDDYWPERVKTIGTPSTSSVAPWLRSNCALEDDTNAAACQEQRDNKMGEYQYSTIMDYGSRFNSDIHGIGHYDEAAIASGYGDLVEVFDNSVTQPLNDAVRTAIRNANGVYSPVGGLVYTSTGLAQGFAQQGLEYALDAHYTDFPQVLGGIANIAKRRWIPRSSYDPTSITGPLKVPYLSCYDEYVDSVENCHRWDAGADAYEITANLIQRYKEYYIFNNYQRDRIGFSGVNVMQSIASRYLLPLTNMYQHWLFSSFWRSTSTPQGALAQLAAVEGFNTLWNVMAAPPYGSYQNNSGEFDLVDERLDQADLNIEPGPGRRQFSRFDYASGYNLFRRVLESGNYYDQVAALMALTSFDASVVGAGSDVQADVLRFSIPYYLVFSDDLNTLFGSIFKQDWSSYANQVVGGALTPRSIFSDPTAPADGFIRTDMNFSTRVLTLLYGMAFFSSNFDLSFVQRCQVSLVGSGEDVSIAAGFDRIETHNPLNGRVYASFQKTGGENGPWFAAEMLTAIDADVLAYEAMADGTDKTNLGFSLQQRFEDIEIMRSLYQRFQFSF